MSCNQIGQGNLERGGSLVDRNERNGAIDESNETIEATKAPFEASKTSEFEPTSSIAIASSLEVFLVKSKRGMRSCSSKSSLASARSIKHFCLERVHLKQL